MAGRRPTPTALKIATGNPGRRPLNAREPKPEPGMPDPPATLSDGARRHWFGLVPILASMGILFRADSLAFVELCETAAEIDDYRADIRKKGRYQVVKTKSGAKFERQRPVVANLADASRRLKTWLIDFGLTPAARSKVNVPEQPENGASAKYFSA